MKRRRTVEARFLRHGKWWLGWTDDVPGAWTQGRTLAEARENLRDAVRLMLEPVEPNAAQGSRARQVTEVLSL
jgi:hypothetical protein